MPSLHAFGHRWGVGSDDLAVPASFEAAASATWLITFGRTLYHQYASLPAAPWAPAVRQLYMSAGVLHSCNLLLLTCLIHNSFLGTLINSGPRRRASYFLSLKIIYEGFTVGLSLAAIRLNFFIDLTAAPKHVVTSVRNSSRGIWAVTVVSSFVMWHILNPHKRKPFILHDDEHPAHRDLEHTESVQEALTATWKERFHSLGKFLGIEGHPALNKVGRLFSEYLQETNDLDIVATDVIAALMILVKEQKRRFARIERKSPSLGLTQPLPPDPQPWMTTHEAAHYMKYAAGCYGWPMYIWSSPFALWGLGRVLIRSRYLPRSLPDNVVDDNMLMVNTTVIKMVTGLTDEQLVLVSFHNKLFEVPFYIALDHEEKSVVVTIRGTLSLEDILTDLSAFDNKLLDIPGVSGASAHEGIYYAADYLMGRLLGTNTRGQHIEQGLIELALQRVQEGKAQDYKLVIVGHSLGAGVAGVLALLMRPNVTYGPRLQCFAYSPPGGLLSESASKYAESFVCSVVLGDDIVGRLGLINLHDLKVKVLTIIRDLDVPKHQIFQGWFRNLLNKALGVSETDLIYAKDKHSWSDKPQEQKLVQDFQKSLQRSIDWSSQRISDREQMYPPGCVMYIDEVSNNRYTSTFVPMNSYLFGEIILSKTVIKHHTPWAVLHALQQLSQLHSNTHKTQ